MSQQNYNKVYFNHDPHCDLARMVYYYKVLYRSILHVGIDLHYRDVGDRIALLFSIGNVMIFQAAQISAQNSFGNQS